MAKQVTCTAETFPNYLGHLFGTAQIGFRNDYPSRHPGSVAPEDIAYLREHAHLLQWLSGAAGDLSPYFVFIPGYLGPGNAAEIAGYFAALRQTIREGTARPLLERYPALRRLADWTFQIPDDAPTPESLRRNEHVVERLADIYVRNHDGFIRDVWPEERPKVQRRVEELNGELSGHQVIADWEALTSRSFLYPRYEFVLGIGIEGGPNFNSLGYEKNWAYYRTDLLFEGIVHEVGTHLLIDVARLAWGKYDSRLANDTYETLCDFYCEKILAGYSRRQTQMKSAREYSAKTREIIEAACRDDPERDAKDVYLLTLDRLSA